MSELLTTPLLRREGARPRAPWLAAVFAALWALVAGLALMTLPVVIAWLAGGAEQSPGSIMGVGGDVWLVAHRIPVDAGTGVITLAPWGMAIPIVLLIFHAARWATHTSALLSAAQGVAVVLVLAATYGLGGGIVAVVTGDAGPLVALLLTGLLALVAAMAGIAVECGLFPVAVGLLPARPRSVLVAASIAAMTIVAGGAALVVVSLAVQFDRVTEMTRSLDAGLTGGLLVTLIGAALLPNAAVWAGSYSVGAGFAIGTGTLVSPFEVRLGALPALPVLAGLPTEHGSPAGQLVLALPVVAGILAAAVLHRAGKAPLIDRVCDALVVGIVAGLFMGGLAALSGGAAGPGRLAEVGPGLLPLVLLTAAEVGVTAAAAAVVLAVVPRAGELAGRPPEAEAPAVTSQAADPARRP